jgi:hypothetical protein
MPFETESLKDEHAKGYPIVFFKKDNHLPTAASPEAIFGSMGGS